MCTNLGAALAEIQKYRVDIQMLERVKLILKIFFHAGPHASLYSDGEKTSQLGNVTKEALGDRLKGVIGKEVDAVVESVMVYAHERRNGHTVYKVGFEFDKHFEKFVHDIRK